ncbi:hypothetical protein R6Q59_012788 [Mikania micrantha]|uniref:Leucine-rich repeat-containing N-terminal plant-type domain-containing protein n=1 Tax=Mikania micrantha TaxID=192012 RepID=A0A5N6LLP3_9ASTR|nr:hypothetical protein E3N88_40099 [Mikania micrantha]
MCGGRSFLFFICITHFFAVHGDQATRRESLQIIIGGGDTPPSAPPPDSEECPPPSPPPCPPPPPPPCPPPPVPKPSPPPPPKIPPSPPPPPKIPPSPPPKRPPPKRPPPSGFESPRLELVYPVIQAFKNKVISDPKGITNTWRGKNICRDYKGFLCDIVPKYNQKALAGVKFNNFNFGGPNLTLTDFLTGLPDLVFFHANSNNFLGTIPTDLNKLEYFYELDLSNNKFSGGFPSQVLRASKLQFLDLRFNTFVGVVPPQVFLLNLDLLFINDNNFIQKLPDNLGSTTALYLTLANNKFVGGIPPSIGQASDTLLEVLFLNNQLTGCLPYQIGLLQKATVFDVGSNYLTGPIPHSFQCLKKMEILNLARNNFYGVVPEAVCTLPKLENFTLSYNYFTQVGPECRKLIKNGVLDVKMNCILDLPDQRSAADCANFFSTHHYCPNERSLNYVPCSLEHSGYHLNSSDIQLSSPVSAPVMAPAKDSRRGSYGALSPH